MEGDARVIVADASRPSPPCGCSMRTQSILAPPGHGSASRARSAMAAARTGERARWGRRRNGHRPPTRTPVHHGLRGVDDDRVSAATSCCRDVAKSAWSTPVEPSMSVNRNITVPTADASARRKRLAHAAEPLQLTQRPRPSPARGCAAGRFSAPRPTQHHGRVVAQALLWLEGDEFFQFAALRPVPLRRLPACDRARGPATPRAGMTAT